MPALVPPGFTRGPILMMNAAVSEPAEAALLQRFWTEAGGYGARILILPALDDPSAADRYLQRLRAWEPAAIEVLPVAKRSDAQQAKHQTAIDQATALLILEGSPLRFAGLLGGTPVAQAIRRANARGKVIAGMGRGAALLCQHMIAFEHPSEPRQRSQQPVFLHRKLLQFAPGLGIINRLVLDVGHLEPSAGPDGKMTGNDWQRALGRLLTAVAYNPFLIGVGLEPSVGVAIYPDSTLEVFGEGAVLVVDGTGISDTNVHEYESEAPLSLLGVQLHVLGRGYTFNFDLRTAYPPVATDIPTTVMPEKNTSSF